jgi:hypothetical protein
MKLCKGTKYRYRLKLFPFSYREFLTFKSLEADAKSWKKYVDLTAPTYLNRHSLTVNGKDEGITRKDLEAVAIGNDIQDYKVLIDTVACTIDKFGEYAKEFDVDEQFIGKVLSLHKDSLIDSTVFL